MQADCSKQSDIISELASDNVEKQRKISSLQELLVERLGSQDGNRACSAEMQPGEGHAA